MMKRKLIHLFGVVAILLMASGQSFAQNMQVQGRVLDELGEGLIGAGVVIQGTTQGTVTDIDGYYELSVPQGATLEFSCVGYKTQQVVVNKARLDVTLEPDSRLIDESVVIAYGQQNKVTITGAVTAVGGETLMKSPVANVANALQGNLPGVSAVQPSGMPGADEPVIRIRGVGSLNSADPLVLVDGVERSFSQLDPNEIESISVLKDASATAVFGVRGANGVILVTTKRGEVGKASVTASLSAAMQSISKFIDFTDSYTYGQMYNYTQITDALPMSQWPGTVNIADYTPYAGEAIGIRFSQDVMEHFRLGDMPQTFPNVDWIKYIMNDVAWQEQANVNVSGGTERVRYFVSAGFLNQNSLFKTFSDNKNETFDYQRLNYRANLDIDVSKYSQLSITLGGRMQTRNTMGGGEGNLFRYLQGATPYAGAGIDEEGRQIVSDPNIVGPFDRSALSNYYNLGYVNESTNVLNFDIQYKLDLGFLTKGLDFKAKASYNSEYTAQKNRKNGYGTGVTYVATLVNGEEVLRKENVTWPLPYSEGKWGGRNWYAEASLNYARRFGKHNVGGLLLYNQSKTYYPWDSDGSLYQSIPKGYVGLVGRVTYDYDTKYLLDLNIGYNGSENFAPGKRYGLFPSVSVGWIPSQEKWWEPIKNTVSYLKFRASYGLVGNDNTRGARFLYLPGAWQFYTGKMTTNPQDRGTNFGVNGNWLPAVKELTAGNPNVTWETATKINVGVDAGFFKDKLHAYVDFFWEDRRDILVSNESTLSAVTSLPSSYVNEGRVKNHGFEVTLNWEQKFGDFRYSISPNFAFARNKIIEMLEVKPMYDYLSRTGLPVGQPFGYDLFGFYQEGVTEELYKEKYGVDMPDQGIASIKNGDAVYVDLNGDGLIDQNDVKPLGYTDNPEITYSVNFNFQWKGLDFSMLWIGADHVSRKLNGYFRDQFGSTNTSALTQWVADNSWTEDNTDAILPRISFLNRVHNNRDSQAWMIDSKYVRLKNVEIGYTFTPRKDGFFNYVRVYASGNNLLTFADFKGNDPEAPGSGLDYGVRYPMTRLFNIGAQFNF
ncbi:MAG: TonB-dependent receptor [Bacteroidales bacterium]|nr:TonB-dependent receptor [Bacteroidales bacterium]